MNLGFLSIKSFLHFLIVFIVHNLCQQFLFYFVHLILPGAVDVLYRVYNWNECILNISKAIYNRFEITFGMLRHVENPWQRRRNNFLRCNVSILLQQCLFTLVMFIKNSIW